VHRHAEFHQRRLYVLLVAVAENGAYVRQVAKLGQCAFGGIGGAKLRYVSRYQHHVA
jgi:hypothetical protein